MTYSTFRKLAGVFAVGEATKGHGEEEEDEKGEHLDVLYGLLRGSMQVVTGVVSDQCRVVCESEW